MDEVQMDIPGILALSIPIVAIVVGGAVAISKMFIRHRERMALIAMGIHPDSPPLDEEHDDRPAEENGHLHGIVTPSKKVASQHG